MKTQAYFEDIESHIANELGKTQASIKLAVAWFTNPNLFERIQQKSKQGVAIQILLMEDDINIGAYGLDFSTLEAAGVKINGYRKRMI